MAQNLDLKELERKAFRSTFQDGLLDIFLGAVLLLFAVTPLLTDLGLGDFWSSVVMGCGWLVAWLGLALAKRHVTVPRMGRVKPGPARRARHSRMIAISTVVLFAGVLAGFAVYLLPQPDTRLLDWLVPALLGLVTFGMFSLCAHLLDLPRLYGYGVLVGLAAPAGELAYRHGAAAHHGWPIAFGIAGSAIVVVGAVTLARFVRAFPVVREGEP